MQHVGIDVGKEHCALVIVNEFGDKQTSLTIPNNPDGFDELDDHLDPTAVLALEACPYAFPLYRYFQRQGFTVKVAHPPRLALITQSESKTDMNDAEILAELVRVDFFPEAYLPPPEVLEVRDIARDRREVGEELGRWKKRIQSMLDTHGTRPPEPINTLWTQQGQAWLKHECFTGTRSRLLAQRVRQIEVLDERKHMLEELLAEIALEDERAHCVMSLPGARWYTAVYILGEIGEIHRFDDVDAFKKYSRCCPKESSTGGRQDPYGVVQHGHSGLKWAFGIVAKTLKNYPVGGENDVRAAYEQGMADTGDHGKAMARARRETCELVYHLVRKQETCRWTPDSVLGNKLADARRLAG